MRDGMGRAELFQAGRMVVRYRQGDLVQDRAEVRKLTGLGRDRQK
jgi:hypothetical protein